MLAGRSLKAFDMPLECREDIDPTALPGTLPAGPEKPPVASSARSCWLDLLPHLREKKFFEPDVWRLPSLMLDGIVVAGPAPLYDLTGGECAPAMCLKPDLEGRNAFRM